MLRHRAPFRQAFSWVASAVVAIGVAACNGSGAAPIAGTTLTASPAVFAFSLARFPTQDVIFSSAGFVAAPLVFSVSDPTIAGVAASSPVPGGFLVTLLGIAQGTTTVTATDARGFSGSVAASSTLCGRPSDLSGGTQLVYPVPGTSRVSVGVGTLYFAVESPASATPRLHLIAGAHGTLEGGVLQPAVPPPGAVTVTPPPTGTLQYMSATIPVLQSGTTYRTQLYDDGCQPALLTGGFST